ncbi:unnamed protein product, partial [Ectocarpus sp. 8 AP-2014]
PRRRQRGDQPRPDRDYLLRHHPGRPPGGALPGVAVARRGVFGLHLLRLVDRDHENLPRGELRNRVRGLRPSHSPMVKIFQFRGHAHVLASERPVTGGAMGGRQCVRVAQTFNHICRQFYNATPSQYSWKQKQRFSPLVARYVAASSGPKDVVIVVDISGSMMDNGR